jgi:hypothetical protein
LTQRGFVIACDNGGSVGSALTLFEQAARKVAERPTARTPLSPDVMRSEAAKIRREIAEATALAEAAWVLRDAEVEAAALRRRLERTVAAEARRVERERLRAEGGLYANQPRSDARATRLAVEPGAWNVVKNEALSRRVAVGYLVARFVADAVAHNTVPRAVRDERCVTQHFIRLIGLDVETWTTFRAMALDAHVTSTRMVGLVVEAEARRLGWRPSAEPAV